MRSVFLILTLTLLLLTACRESAQTPIAPDLHIDLRAEGLAVGSSVLEITLTGADGQPVTAKTVELRGDMTHAGMQPVLAETSEGEAGVYRVPFDWTMGGDWLVTVKVTLPDGAVAEQRFDLTITQ